MSKVRLALTITIWAIFVFIAGSIYYVNHYLPHGPKYPTGEFNCRNDDRGPCSEEYIEDMRDLDISNWAKFLRKADGELLLLSLGIAGVVVGTYRKNEE